MKKNKLIKGYQPIDKLDTSTPPKKKKSNKKLKKLIALEDRVTACEDFMISFKQEYYNNLKTEHLTEEQTEAVGKTVETEPVEEKVVEYSHFVFINNFGTYDTTIESSNHKITKYANEETPVIKKL
jgi:hypothetical protein